MVAAGATTMWERWDSIQPDGGFQSPTMNSFNHYAYGSVGEWMYANIAGLASGWAGYRRIVVRPRPGGDVTSAKATFASLYGPVSTRWQQGPGGFVLSCAVLPNTSAEVWISTDDLDRVKRAGGGGSFCVWTTAVRSSRWIREATASP